MDNTGGVPVIGTLVPANPGKYPVVRACDVSLSNGENLESFVKKNFNSVTLSDSGGDIVTETEVLDTPFLDVNENNVIRIRLKKNGKQVFCSIASSLQLPDHGVISFEGLKLPREMCPIFPVYMPFIAIKNERERGNGQFIISKSGHVNLYTTTDEDAERCASTSWIVG